MSLKHFKALIINKINAGFFSFKSFSRFFHHAPCCCFTPQALKLPLMPPILPNKDSGEFPHGANFAVLGATARGVHYTRNDSVAAPCSLGVQMGWFDEMQQRIAPGDGNTTPYNSKSGQYIEECIYKNLNLI